MSVLLGLLEATLNPSHAIRNPAEQALVQLQAEPAFSQQILQLILDPQSTLVARQAATLCFKNYIKLNWGQAEAPTPLTVDTALYVKHEIVSVMLSLNSHPQLQSQMIQSITLIAHADFPHDWPALMDQLVGSLSATDYVQNNAVLATAHSIFKKWRAEFRTDELFTEIKFVLDKFCTPYLGLFKQTDALLSNPAALTAAQHALLLKTVLLLLQLYHDLNSQDLPEFFEDVLPSIMQLLLKYLDYTPPAQLVPADQDDDEEAPAGDLEKIKTQVCEIATLYSLRYLDAFGEGGYLGPFVERTWGLLTGLGNGSRYDSLVAHATAFLAVVVKMPSQRALFEAPATLESFCERIVLPNMTLRLFEEELFEDDAPEYVRRDLESANSETRRQAASDFTRALMEQFETQVTAIVTRYIGAYLQQYASDPITHWKSKDTAIFLLTSIASKGSTMQQGVTSTNALVDVVKFFSDHVLADLQALPGSVHPIIQADAVKFLYTFRNQLTKDQLISVLPLLVPQLQNPSFVIHTYAAITIERILFIKQNGTLLFGQSDIRPYAENILMALFTLIEQGTTPQLVAANDHLMKSVMRVIITAKQALTPVYGTVLSHLTKILLEISKNPSNPKFNHYTFESISALIRFITAGNPSTLSDFEGALFPPFHSILQQDVTEFTPFVFQILSQLLELHPITSFPAAYSVLLPPLLTPTLWEAKGNVPALVRLLRAFLQRGAEEIVRDGRVTGLLGVFQHLIKSKANDAFGFELLESLVEFIPLVHLNQYMSNPVFVLLLTRLQTSKTDKFCQGLLRFICFTASLQKEGLDADAVIRMLDSCQPQPGLFAQVLPVLLPQVQKAPKKDRKIIAVGLANLLSRSQTMLSEPSVRVWTPTMIELLKLLVLPLPLSAVLSGTSANGAGADEVEIPDADDPGYQASFSKLGSAEKAREDPVAFVADPRVWLATNLVSMSQAHPGKPMLLAAGPQLAQPFMEYLVAHKYHLV